MYARIQTFHQTAEKLDEIGAHIHKQLEAKSQVRGFSGFKYLIDRDRGKALLISFWETEADLRRLEATNGSAREQAQAEAGIDPPEAEVFEVALQDP